MSIDEFERTIPVSPPIVNRNTNPDDQSKEGVFIKYEPDIEEIQLKIFTPVGTAMTMVAAVKYARVSTSIPTVNIWCPQTINPRIPIDIIAWIIAVAPEGSFFPDEDLRIWEIIPNPGRIKMYTSGWPKNQNKCWNKIGSPPPEGSKNVVLKFRSVRSIVIPPANTGRDSRSSKAVIRTDHGNIGICSHFIVFGGKFIIVAMKLIAPKIEEIPAKWREKIVKSIEIFPWAIFLERGG